MKQLFCLIATCMIFVSVSCSKDSPAVTVVPAAKIVINQPSFVLKPGGSRQLTATMSPSDVTDRSIVWSSDDESVATVSKSGVVTAVGIGKTTVRVAAVTDKSVNAGCVVAVMNRDPYAVGDLYPNATSPLGMVFWVDPADAGKGKIVSLDETVTTWGDKDMVAGACDMNDGMANQKKIEAIAKWKYLYQAFAWCADKGDGWYLPALNELLALYDAKETLNEVIVANGDAPLTDGYYWSSTEQPENAKNIALTVLFTLRNDNESWANKNGTCSVRAIMAFE